MLVRTDTAQRSYIRDVEIDVSGLVDPKVLYSKRNICFFPDISKYHFERILNRLIGEVIINECEVEVFGITVVLEIELLEHRPSFEGQGCGQHLIGRHSGKNPCKDIILLNLCVPDFLPIRFLLYFCRPYQRINCLSR